MSALYVTLATMASAQTFSQDNLWVIGRRGVLARLVSRGEALIHFASR
jgi:hypothetical protein